MATPIQTSYIVPAIVKDEVVAELSKVGTVTAIEQENGTFKVSVDATSLVRTYRSQIVSPVAVDGSGHTLIGRVDTGSVLKVNVVDESDPIAVLLEAGMGERDPMYGGFSWQLFTGIKVTEAIREKAKDGICDHCEVNRKDRRYLYLAQDTAGNIYTLGSTCGITKFGADLGNVFKLATKDLPKKLKKTLRDSTERVIQTVNFAAGRQELVKYFGIDPLPLFEKLVDENPGASSLLNIMEILRSYRVGDRRLTGWVVARIRREISREKEPVKPTPVFVAPEKAGEKVEATVKILNQKYEVGPYGGYYKTLTERVSDGLKVWWRSKVFFNPDATLNVIGEFAGSGEGIVFLKRVKVS